MGGTGKPLEERPALVQGVGVGGTGSPARGVGTGGTGSAIPSPELEAPGGIGGTGNTLPGGIGGTGQGVPGVSDLAGHPGAEVGVGGTGIVGTITGFASVCVNGVEVHYEDAVPVSKNGEPASVNALAVGQVVVIDAHGSSRGLEARSIAVVHALDGPVTEIAGDRRSMKVMGQTVRFAGSGAVPAGLNAGDRVAVSGLRGAGGVVMASRIDRGRPDRPVSAVGLVGADHSLYGVPLAVAGRAKLMSDQEMLVQGKWNGKAIEVAQTASNPMASFAGRAGRAIVEGWVHQASSAKVTIDGFVADVGAGTVVSGAQAVNGGLADRKVRISGTLKGRHIVAERIAVADRNGRFDAAPAGVRLSPSPSATPAAAVPSVVSVESAVPASTSATGVSATAVTAASSSNVSATLERKTMVETVVTPTPASPTNAPAAGVRLESRERSDRRERAEKVEKAEKAEKVEKVKKVKLTKEEIGKQEAKKAKADAGKTGK